MHTAMVISPHADDASAFCGATLAKFASEGWNIILVRVTDDSRDSVGLSLEETKRRNTEELHDAANILGVSKVIELGYETDCLSDVSFVGLRERFVYLFRMHRPYAVFGFDPFGLYEPNMDHIRVAQATEEAFWVSCFDLHHPEHFKKGLKPFSVCERWYFARELPKITHVEDVTDYIKKKVDALCAQKTAMMNLLNQYKLQLETWGRKVKLIEFSMQNDMRPLIEGYITEKAKAVAKEFKLGEDRMGEAFRLVRFGDLEELFQTASEPIPNAIEPPKRPSLDIYK